MVVGETGVIQIFYFLNGHKRRANCKNSFVSLSAENKFKRVAADADGRARMGTDTVGAETILIFVACGK